MDHQDEALVTSAIMLRRLRHHEWVEFEDMHNDDSIAVKQQIHRALRTLVAIGHVEIETRNGFARRYRITETGKLLLLATRNSPSPSGA